MMEIYGGLSGREKAISDIYEELLYQKSLDIILIGNHGSGRKFVLNSVVEKLKTNHFSTLKFVGDQLIEDGVKYLTRIHAVTLSLSVYLGITYTNTENNDNQIRYLLNCFKKSRYKNIVILAPDIERCSAEIKNIITILLEQKEFFEHRLSKKISIMLSTGQADYFAANSSLKRVKLPPYSEKDVYDYLNIHHHYQSNILPEKLKKINEICKSDLNLVNLISREILNNDEICALEQIISQKIDNIKQIGKTQNISPSDMEEIILTCALSMDRFSRFEISKTTERPEEMVNGSFRISLDENLFDEPSKNLYSFVSDDIKNVLELKMLQRHNSRLLNFYNYLAEYRPSDYFYRAYYLIKFLTKIDSNAFSLLILALAQAHMLKDIWIQEQIGQIVKQYGTSVDQEWFYLINEAYKAHTEQKYHKSNHILGQINFSRFGSVARAELNRLRFMNGYLMAETCNCQFKTIVSNLIEIVQKNLQLDEIEELILIDEINLRLKIIYDIAPYVLDNANDYELFTKLFQLSEELANQCKNNKSIEFMRNIFYRKAFLFSNPMTSMCYYDQAKAFFKENHIWDEYCITLICQGGTNLACHEYDACIQLCKEAYALIHEYDITIPKQEKLLNNYKIAEFLKYEEEHGMDIASIETEAKKTATELASAAGGPACGTKHVLLTNAASLYLYSNQLDRYQEIKRCIEDSLACQNVADIQDESVNDFYRYHFAWFEIFYCIQTNQWDKCNEIINQLDHFIPALFKKQENLWQEKNEAAKKLILERKRTNGYEFCNHLVQNMHREKQLSAFYHRGLMLSDLQYTAYS